MKTIKITDNDIQALIDGEFTPEKYKILMSVISRSPELLNRYESLLQQKKLLQNWWKSFYHES